MQITDETQQKADWRGRLCADVLSNFHDEETKSELLMAGLRQAHEEGLADAAYICECVARDGPRTTRDTAQVLGDAIRQLIARNKLIDR